MELNKNLYKTSLVLLKLLPIIMSLTYCMNITCGIFGGIEWQVIPHFIGLTIAPMLFILISSYVFQFCNYHRMFIYYITVESVINSIDWYIGIPVSDFTINVVHLSLTILFLSTAIIMYLYKKRRVN